MNKAKIKNLLVDKGERYGLIAAGGAMLLFLILGVMEMSGSPNPESYVATVDKNAATINSTVNGAVVKDSVKRLPDVIIHPMPDQVYKSSWANNLFFDPFAPPDKRRVNPVVLALTDNTQADFMWVRIPAYDFRDGPDGPLIGVLFNKPKSNKSDKNDNELSPKFLEDLKKQYHLKIPRRPNPPPMGNGGPVQAPQAGFGGPQPGVGGAMPGQRTVGPPGMRGGRERMNPRRDAGSLVEEGTRMGIQYLPFDLEKLKDYRFALTIYPQRFVIVEAALPYKAQIEEIRNALRLQDPLDVFTVYKDEDVPLFRGFVVQRKMLYPDGKIADDWADLDIEKSYREVVRRRYQPYYEDPKINYLLLPSRNRLAAELPYLLNEKYPDIRIPELKETMRKQAELNKPPEPPKAASQFDSDASIYGTDAPGTASLSNQPNIGNNLPKRPALREGDPNRTGTSPVSFQELPEYKLVRFIDNNILPGFVYKYRIKVLMQNPNWVGLKDKKTDVAPHKEKYDLVSRPSDADVEIIESPWTEVKESVSVPSENFLFAIDPPSDARGRWLSPTALKEGQGLLQIQRWISKIAAYGNNKEPVGDWLVADLVATHGTYLGGKQFVNLPLWASEFNRYILREVPPERGHKQTLRGVVTDPTRPGPHFAVVEVSGGACEYKPPTRSITLREETAAEVLLMDDDGALQVRSSYSDRFDSGRAKREGAWKNWIDQTERETKSVYPETQPGDKGFKD